uniref:Insulinase family protein n=1 Tax=Eiseniibacteriota bacterium TaxID=2212470 RepID=A0A832MLH6_UNCEI
MRPRRTLPCAAPALACAAVLAIAAAAGAPAGAAPARRAAAPAAPRTGLESLERQVKEFTLPNGLKFIVVERRQSPVFSFSTVVNAGSADEQVGTTGIAHMMEHMAFKGTSIVGTHDHAAERPLLEAEERAYEALLAERRKGARADTAALRRLEAAFAAAQEAARAKVVSNGFTAVLEQNGATGLNAFTADDITAYYYSLPSNRLELWALMEGGRMQAPVFREFYKERDVVIEERRMRYESSPLGRLFWEFITTAFVAHPYGFGGIGYPSDLRTFSRSEGEAFYRRNYVAKNMAVAVVGDVALDDVKRVAEIYWSGLSDAPAPPPVDTVEPEQKAERRILLEDAAQSYIMIGWRAPAATDPTYPAFEAAASLLAGGDFARLHKTLVKEKKLCTQIQMGVGFPGEKYPNLLVLFAVPAAGQDPLAVEAEIHAAMDEVMNDRPFTAEELEGYKVRVRSQKIAQVEQNSGLALALAQTQMIRGDWREFFRDAERVQALRVDDVMAALRGAVHKSKRTVAMIVPPKTADAAEGGR